MDNMINPSVFIYPDSKKLFTAIADDFEHCAAQAIAEKNYFLVVLSGGSTPLKFYSVLVNQYAKKIEWEKIYFFFGDERYVPKDNKENNYYMAEKYLFSQLPIHPIFIYRIDTGYPTAGLTAAAYQKTLREVLQLKSHEFPVFDLVYLGLGEDAHTASLFPKTSLIRSYVEESDIDKNQLVSAYYVEKLKMDRITLTPPAINHSKNIHFIVNGKNKADAVQAVLQAPYQPLLYPAQLIKSIDGTTSWYLDKTAAAKVL